MVFPGSNQGGFVAQIGQISPTETGGSLSQCVQVNVWRQAQPASVDFQEFPSRPLLSGKPTKTWRSNRPGRKRAGSRTSERLVAAKTIVL